MTAKSSLNIRDNLQATLLKLWTAFGSALLLMGLLGIAATSSAAEREWGVNRGIEQVSSKSNLVHTDEIMYVENIVSAARSKRKP